MAQDSIAKNVEKISPEKIITPQAEKEIRQSEQMTEKTLETGGEKTSETVKPIEASGEVATQPITAAKTVQEIRAAQIDKILEDGLADLFLGMSPKEQAVFKRAGEETTIKINKLLDKTRLNIKKIVNLIRRWLRLIPGINKFFLEQEAKIKADEISRLKKQ